MRICFVYIHDHLHILLEYMRLTYVCMYVGCVAFDVEYKGWADEHQRLINDLRWALNCRLSDTGLHLVVEQVMSNYHELFRMKRSGAKSDIFHILSGSWKTPAERFFMWLGGFRSSDLLKVIN